MRSNKARRWLAVANRAADFRTLLQSADVSASKRQADESSTAHARGQDMTHRARAAWREQGKAASFHVAGDAVHRRFHGHLTEVEADLAMAADQAREQLAAAEAALRLELARRDGLKKSLDKATQRMRDERNRQALKEADETWNVLQNRRADEDR